MLTKEQAKQITSHAISLSTVPECSVSLTYAENAFIRYALNGITTSGFQVEQLMIISVSKDGKTGATVVTEFDDKSLKDAMVRAEGLASISPPNPEKMDALPPQKYAEYDNFDESTAAARNKEMIPAVRAVLEGSKSKGFVAAGFFERSAEVTAVANKRGNFGYQRATDARLSTTVRTSGGTSSGWASGQAVRVGDIDGGKLAATAIGKCEKWQNPKQLEPGKYTVVLEPTATGDLVQLLGFSFNARSAEEGRSFLSKKGQNGASRLGEKMFPDFVTLRSDPFDKRFPTQLWAGGFGAGGSEPMPNGKIAWIEKGVIRNLWYDRYYASKAGKEPTPFPTRLILEGGSESTEALIAQVERGLLVTRFWYIRPVNQQTAQFTGLTRDGLFLIENGKVTTPVVNFRFNESPVRLLQNTVKFGKVERVRGGEGAGMIAPSLVAKEFPFTSISDAV